MSNTTNSNGQLKDLLGQVPDRHHAKARGTDISVNGRHPPPLDAWNPEYCGDVDMAIAADGTWYHEGVPIKHTELWQLFAGILRREGDSEFYLVTPVEKCRVKVVLHPLIIIDFSSSVGTDGPQLSASLNAGGCFPVSADYPLKPESRAGGAAYIELPHGLTALCSRSAWYRLVDMADEAHSIVSHGSRFFLA